MISSFCAACRPQCVDVRPVEGGYVTGRGDVGPGVVVSSSVHRDTKIYFDYHEWDAFVKGVKAGEFDRETMESLLAEIRGSKVEMSTTVNIQTMEDEEECCQREHRVPGAGEHDPEVDPPDDRFLGQERRGDGNVQVSNVHGSSIQVDGRSA